MGEDNSGGRDPVIAGRNAYAARQEHIFESLYEIFKEQWSPEDHSSPDVIGTLGSLKQLPDLTPVNF